MRYGIEIIVFICGAVVMIFELVGSRILGPFLGTTIFVWTSLIGIILASLSLGYWLGGYFADKKPKIEFLSTIIFFSAALIIFTTIIQKYFLNHLPSFIYDIRLQSIIASIVLFAPASIFLGMVSPFTIKLKLKQLESTGKIAGKLYAISTFGSICGTFLAGFFFIPYFGHQNILFFLSALLLFISIILFLSIRSKFKSGFAILFLVFLLVLKFSIINQKASIIDVDTKYNRVMIYDANDYLSGKPVKYMRINNEYSGAMFLGSDELVFQYLKYYDLAKHFNPDFQQSLLIGGATYSYPKHFLNKFPKASIDVVEIDPELTKLAREYFQLSNDPRMKIIHEDGRTFLNNCSKKYDVVFIDAFKSQYTLPYQLTTREAVQKIYNILNVDGQAILNIISSIGGKSSLFLQAEYLTYKSVFPQVYLFAIQNMDNQEQLQSVVMIALKSEKIPNMNNSDSILNEYLKHILKNGIETTVPILTDEFAPVEFYMNKAI
ncbi:MAG: fused MFS/spermidine synthase [Bacteroidales bacterium]|nr:fused MFS/spermidine synthase [Bacteroidales bacterium]